MAEAYHHSKNCQNNNNFNKLKQTKPKQQFKILIVDDDVNISECFADILTERGHIVSVANESVSCINKCQNYQYDIIFMDFHMDSIDGVDMTDLLKNVCNNTSLIIAITGDDSVATIRKFKEIGMAGAIIKPINVDLIHKFMNSLETRSNIDKRVINLMGDTKFKRHLIVFD